MEKKSKGYIRFQKRPLIITEKNSEKEAIVEAKEVPRNKKNQKQKLPFEQQIIKKQLIVPKQDFNHQSPNIKQGPRKDILVEQIKSKNLFKKKKRKLTALMRRKRPLIDIHQVMNHPNILRCFGLLKMQSQAHSTGIGYSLIAESQKNEQQIRRIRPSSQDQIYKKNRIAEKLIKEKRKMSNPQLIVKENSSYFSIFGNQEEQQPAQLFNGMPSRPASKSSVNYLQFVEAQSQKSTHNHFQSAQQQPNYLQIVEEQLSQQSFSQSNERDARFNFR